MYIYDKQSGTMHQCGRTCGAIDEASTPSKTFYKRVIVNSRDKNVVKVRFRDKMKFLIFFDKIS